MNTTKFKTEHNKQINKHIETKALFQYLGMISAALVGESCLSPLAVPYIARKKTSKVSIRCVDNTEKVYKYA